MVDVLKAAASKHPGKKLEEARAKHLNALVKAAIHTRWLARREQEGTGDSSKRVLTQQAHAPLLALVEDWGGDSAKQRVLAAEA